MKKAIAFALLGVCLAGAAWAQSGGANTVSRNGYYFNSTTGEKTDADGNAYVNDADRDRDYSTILTVADKNSLLGGNCFITDNATWFAPYSGGELLVSWQTAAAADSDSVAIAIYVYATTSSSMAGANFLLAPATVAPTDTGVVCPTGGIFAAPFRKLPPTVLILSPNKGPQGGIVTLKAWDTTHRAYSVPPSRIRYVQGSNAVSINLGDLYGSHKAQYLGFMVANWGSTQLNQVSVKIWPKVN